MDKPDSIPLNIKPILKRLQIESDTWMKQVNHFGKRYFRVAGSKEIIKSIALKIGVKWMNGQGRSSPFESPA